MNTLDRMMTDKNGRFKCKGCHSHDSEDDNYTHIVYMIIITHTHTG